MTILLVRSGGATSQWTSILGSTGPNGTYSASVYATLSLAIAAASAGDVFCVANDHAETSSTTSTLTFPGTPANPCSVLSTDPTSTAPETALLSGASATTTAGGLNVAGSLVAYGLNLTGLSALGLCNGNTGDVQTWESGIFRISGAAAATYISMGPVSSTNGSRTTFRGGCVWRFSNAGQGIKLWNGAVKITGGVVADSGTVPNAFIASVTGQSSIEATGLDLSAFSGRTIVSSAGAQFAAFDFADCKMPTSYTWNGAASPNDSRLDYYQCGGISGRVWFEGTQATDTTHVRIGGSQNEGVAVAAAISTSSGAAWGTPYEARPIFVDIGSGTRSVTFYVLGPAGLTNKDVWIDVYYLSSALNTLGTIAGSKASGGPFATGTALTADASAWSGTLTGLTPYRITLPNLNIATPGAVEFRPRFAKPSISLWLDYKPLVS